MLDGAVHLIRRDLDVSPNIEVADRLDEGVGPEHVGTDEILWCRDRPVDVRLGSEVDDGIGAPKHLADHIGIADVALDEGVGVVILDVAPMIDRALREQRLPGQLEVAAPAVIEEEVKRTPLVMVVDDSITMRRVTARILENQGLEVITARDGVAWTFGLSEEEYAPAKET